MTTETRTTTRYVLRTSSETTTNEKGEEVVKTTAENVPVTTTEVITRWIAPFEAGASGPAVLESEEALAAQQTTYTIEDAAAAISAKIDPNAGNMDPVLARRLFRMYSSPVYPGATPPGSSNGPVWFQNYYLDENTNRPPDAQVYAYVRDGQLATFEIAGSFARAYENIDAPRAGSNSRLGLPTSGRELGPDGRYFQQFENGRLIEMDPGAAGRPARFTWVNNQGRVVKSNHAVEFIDLSRADQITRGLVKPMDATLTASSEFRIVDAEGAPDDNGVRYHAGKDWFAPAGTQVRAPIDGTIVGVYASSGNSGQVFGGTVMVQGEDGRVWVFRHVDPAQLAYGDRVRAGDAIATVTDWTDGSDHTHIELWRTLEGGYDFENMIDPMDELGIFLG